MATAHLIAAQTSSTHLHGVLLEIFGTGVLLCGISGVGKGELALELISRGHRLIADDAPQFTRTAAHELLGSCPPLLHNFLAVRGLGVLNIQALYGDQAVASSIVLQLIVQLDESTHQESPGIDTPPLQTRNVLGIEISEINLCVRPGRNLALLVECLVRNYLLQLKGYDAAGDFGARQSMAQA